MSAGAATTTVYPSTMAEDVAYILGDSDSHVVFAEDDAQIAKLRAQRADLPALTKVVTFDGTADGDWVITSTTSSGWVSDLLAERVRRGHGPGRAHDARPPRHPDLHLGHDRPAQGRAAPPLGLDLRGRGRAGDGILSIDDVQYLWLPLAHSFGKVLLTTQLAIGFPTAVDGRVDKIIDNLAVVKPTFMGAAPRIFEKAHGRIVTMTAAEGGLKKKIFDRAFKVGLEVCGARWPARASPRCWASSTSSPTSWSSTRSGARFGGRLRFFVSGAAALNRDIAEWFHAAGILILEGYGLTETSAGTCVNRPDLYKFGTVGLPFHGTEIKIADDGEILIKGPGVMDGYHNNPEATAEALTDGWFHTGDIGELDTDGFVRITDRKKDLFKTSGGKYVAPQIIEGQFKAVCPYASQFVVHGNERNFVSALVTLDPDAIVRLGRPERPWRQGRTPTIVTSDEARAMVQGYVDELNAKLNRWETIKRFIILERDLTVEDGEITPSMKVKRKVVEELYRKQLDALYA